VRPASSYIYQRQHLYIYTTLMERIGIALWSIGKISIRVLRESAFLGKSEIPPEIFETHVRHRPVQENSKKICDLIFSACEKSSNPYLASQYWLKFSQISDNYVAYLVVSGSKLPELFFQHFPLRYVSLDTTSDDDDWWQQIVNKMVLP